MASLSDVLIVGAGPVGLTLANELARRRVFARVVDKSTHHTRETKALGMQARTLELLDRLGVAQDAINRALPVMTFNVFSERKQIACFDFSHLDSPFPYTLMLPQNETEEILEKRLGALGGRVDRGVDLVGFNDRGDAVEATLRNAKGETEMVTTRW